jgi:PiT family inorganic phosphate transporter
VLSFLAPVYLGWSLGANDASNVFGTAVASKMIHFLTAALLCAAFVMLGALLEGAAGMETLGGLSAFDTRAAIGASLAAAVTVTLMTFMRLPVSTSQAVVGAIIGYGLLEGGVQFSGLLKVVVCWVGTPLGAMVAAVPIYIVLAPVFNLLSRSLTLHDAVLRACLVVAGCYGAYALGANNAANVTGVFVGAGTISPFMGAVIAGASISLGVLTFSKRVMLSVGKGIIELNGYSALVVILSEAFTVHFYAVVGVPVSTSQAVIGAVIGVGLLKSVETVRVKAILGIFTGWLATPVIAGLVAVALYFVMHLRFVA